MDSFPGKKTINLSSCQASPFLQEWSFFKENFAQCKNHQKLQSKSKAFENVKKFTNDQKEKLHIGYRLIHDHKRSQSAVI